MAADLPEKTEWRGKSGAQEHFFCMTAEPGASFEAELRSLMDRYRELGGGGEDEFLLRFHVSDPVRQSETLRRMAGERNSYVSWWGSPRRTGPAWPWKHGTSAECWKKDGKRTSGERW